jgi:hypothetical protein
MKNLVKNIGEVIIPLTLVLAGCNEYRGGYAPGYASQSFGNECYSRDYMGNRHIRRERVIIIEREKRYSPKFDNAPRYYNRGVDNHRQQRDFIHVRPNTGHHRH